MRDEYLFHAGGKEYAVRLLDNPDGSVAGAVVNDGEGELRIPASHEVMRLIDELEDVGSWSAETEEIWMSDLLSCYEREHGKDFRLSDNKI